MSETITASLTVSGGDTITVNLNTAARGPAGTGGGSNSVTSATTSDGTANLSVSNVSTASGSVSGILTAPTAATTTSTTQVATTAFVQQELASGVAVAKNLEFLARNQSGATITKGSIVYIDGATGNKPLITLAQANSDENSAQTIGFVKTDIANNGTGFVIVRGELENVKTFGATEGQQLYLSPTTAGEFTTTKPSAPEHLVYVGIVIAASTGAAFNGIILVAIQNGYEINEIHDVSISSPAAKQVIKRNAGNALWVNESIISTDVSDSTATGRSLMTATTQSDARTTGLGSGATGDALFTAASASAARATLELGSTDSPTFATLTATKVTSATSLLLSANLAGVDAQRINFASAGATRISIFTNSVQRIGIQNAGQIDISSAVVSTSTVTASNFKRGTGSPESVVTGVVGDIYTRTDGGAGTTLYVKESGTGNTGWVAK